MLGAVSLPLEARLIAVADRLAGALGLFEGPLGGEEMAAAARAQAGLTDFGDTSFEEPLDVLLRDYQHSANLSLFGRLAARWDVLRFLSNLLLFREEEKRCPEILKQSIDRPIFITGMPRSGSSFLHNLIAQDPGISTPLCWQTIYPCPLPSERPGESIRRVELVDQQLTKFQRLAPELSAIHPITALSTQECSEIMAHAFRSLRFDTTHQLAEYPLWLQNAGDLPGYRFHKRFLQHLQYRGGKRRWVLKCPDHTFSMRSIQTVYPDACFVFLHRDPLKVLQSTAKLTEVLRRPFARSVDRLQIGRQVGDSWSRGASLLIAANGGSGNDSASILNIGYRRLITDPVATVAKLYKQFGLPLTEDATIRFAGFVAGRKNGGYSKIQYWPEEFGLDLATEARRFRDYVECFAVETESDTDRSTATARMPEIVLRGQSTSGAY